MTHADPLHLDATTRAELWQAVGEAIEAYYRDVRYLDADITVDADEARAVVERFDFATPMQPGEAIQRVVSDMRRLQAHVMHPRNFGMFDPAPTAMGVVAQALVAAFNPCLASRVGSPFGVEAERFLIEKFAELFGYSSQSADGVITSGGSEANLTGLLLALAARFPGHRERGLLAIGGQPMVYVTSHAHPATLKAVAVTGLGTDAVRRVPTDPWHRMDPAALDSMIRADLAAGHIPLMVVATAGTTDIGVIDPIGELADVAAEHGVWLHLDAAWGGALVLLPELRDALGETARVDSITFDPHKWLSVPMGCGMLLTRHPGLLDQAFGVTTPFLAGREERGVDPHTRSIRWSRDFAGLKLLLSLAVAGWPGYEEALRRQVLLARRLRDGLCRDGWTITNDTPLPVVCFVDADGQSEGLTASIADAVNKSGEARIFVVQAGDQVVLRACVTNYGTTADDIDLLIKLLGRVRTDARSGVFGQPNPEQLVQ
ncbi:MAG TPA: pyridoxal-dependent decarboxylase [Streptosporangiaceae bacterium]